MVSVNKHKETLRNGMVLTDDNSDEWVDELLREMRSDLKSGTKFDIQSRNNDFPIELSIDEFPAYFANDWLELVLHA